jgi:hypothetical protein
MRRADTTTDITQQIHASGVARTQAGHRQRRRAAYPRSSTSCLFRGTRWPTGLAPSPPLTNVPCPTLPLASCTSREFILGQSEDRVRVVAVDVRLLQEQKVVLALEPPPELQASGVFRLAVYEGLDLVRTPWLLCAELIARNGDDLQPRRHLGAP